MHRTLRILLPLLAVAWFAACDNVGRAFDPVVTPPNNPGNSAPSTIQVPPQRGDMRDGRPVVREAYPKGGGWPVTVPVVVEFSESMNESSIVPTTPGGLDGRIVLRIEGTSQALPAVYDLLAGGRLLVLRPLTNLQSPQGTAFEVAMLPGVRDCDGVQTANTAETILATFTLDTTATTEDGAILAIYPRDNARDVAVDSDQIVVFTKPANAATVLLPANFQVRTAAGATVAGVPSSPVVPADARVALFRPTNPAGYAPGTGHELVVTAGVTFGTAGVLRFSNRTPFARFTTGTVPQPVSVTVRGAATGFEDKVNRGNLTALQMDVEVPADTLAGDRVLVRVYGSNRQTQTVGDLAFEERLETVATAGAGTVTAEFAAKLGSLTNPRFDDGTLSFTVQMQRGTAHSGIVLGSADALQDLVAPTLVGLQGAVGTNGTDLYTEFDQLVVFGTASEQLGKVELSTSGAPVDLFSSRSNGTFLTRPVSVGHLTTSVAYSLLYYDLAGNLAAAPATGLVFQRGLITGDGTTGTVVVEAYDEATLRPLAGATVHVDPGAPTVPASVNRQTDTTGADGRATFTGLPAGNHTISVLLAGYDPITLYNAPVGFASLPLRPTSAAAATAAFTGAATLDGTLAGATAIVGNNLIEDRRVMSVRTSTVAPTVIPPTAIQTNRPQVVTAFGGVFEPTANPAFSFHACNLLSGAALATPTPPAVPTAAGGTATAALLLRERGSGTANLGLLVSAFDFNQSLSLNTNGLSPIVRFLSVLEGMSGQALTGVGTPSGAAPNYSVTGTYSTAILDGLADFSPETWVVIEVEDSQGHVCRTRALVNTSTSIAANAITPQWIPVVAAPGGPSSGPPLVTMFEVLDAALVSGSLGVIDLVARDPAGRQWRVVFEDIDDRTSVTTKDFQFPDPGTATGLATGNWSVRATSRLFTAGTGSTGNFLLADRVRRELTYARAASETFVVQ